MIYDFPYIPDHSVPEQPLEDLEPTDDELDELELAEQEAIDRDMEYYEELKNK